MRSKLEAIKHLALTRQHVKHTAEQDNAICEAIDVLILEDVDDAVEREQRLFSRVGIKIAA